jgi:AbrB family transcriptional regulator, transcriptional pleiotropic regulator of transition state genes
VASSGIRRKVDDLGRVVIPASIRRSLRIREGEAVEVSVEGERVVLAKPRESCVFCSREGDDLRTFRGRLLCRECLAGLGVLDERTRVSEEEAQRDFPTVASSAGAAAPTPPPTPTPSMAPRPEPGPSGSDGAGPPRPVRAVRGPGVTGTTGPIDGDASARAEAAGDDHPPSRRRPPQDPASSTAW